MLFGAEKITQILSESYLKGIIRTVLRQSENHIFSIKVSLEGSSGVQFYLHKHKPYVTEKNPIR